MCLQAGMQLNQDFLQACQDAFPDTTTPLVVVSHAVQVVTITTSSCAVLATKAVCSLRLMLHVVALVLPSGGHAKDNILLVRLMMSHHES
jgi:hypothetical protein